MIWCLDAKLEGRKTASSGRRVLFCLQFQASFLYVNYAPPLADLLMLSETVTTVYGCSMNQMYWISASDSSRKTNWGSILKGKQFHWDIWKWICSILLSRDFILLFISPSTVRVSWWFCFIAFPSTLLQISVCWAGKIKRLICLMFL